MQVLPLAKEYVDNPEKLSHIWVYEDEFVKGLLHMEQQEIQELYVEHFSKTRESAVHSLTLPCKKPTPHTYGY